MFVSGGMKDNVRGEFPKRPACRFPIFDINQKPRCRDKTEPLRALALYPEKDFSSLKSMSARACG